MFRKTICLLILTANLFACKETIESEIRSDDSTMISFELKSPGINDTFVIDVSLPKTYNRNNSTRYPVLYLTDGYWRREQHKPIHEMAERENIKELIIVGIGYPDNYKPDVIRVRDLISGADKFLDFIIDELIPRIEKDYRTNGERTLWGSSFGGYFGMYALFNQNKTQNIFQNYIIASPAALEKTARNGTSLNLFDYENLHYQESKTLKAKLYITVGGIEEPARFLNPFKELVDILNGSQYEDFYIKWFIDPGKNHYTVWEPTLYEGIRLFLKKN
jgi:uncharacterized protein